MRYDSYRIADIEQRLHRMRIRPLDVMAAGVTGAGKSTTLNALFQKTVAKVGNGTEPETMETGDYRLNDLFRIWDTPGLCDGVYRDAIHKRKLVDLLFETYTADAVRYGFIDLCLVIIEGSNRDMGTTYTLLNEVIVPNIQADRILVAINQADLAMKGRHWNRDTNRPDPVLLDFLEEQARSVQKRVKEATGVSILRPVCYSAEYGWNITAVLDMIIDNIPSVRRQLITS